MNKSSTRISRHERRARWRKLVDRQAASGRSVAAFCRDESIAVQTFYWWKARLGKSETEPHARALVGTVPFIDLGAVAGVGAAEVTTSRTGVGIEIRLDLPGGITLSIARR